MIFFENSYSADTRDQIEDRIHRRGQTGEYVLYIDMERVRFGPPDRQGVATQRRALSFGVQGAQTGGAGMNVFEGAAAREALVQRLVNELAPVKGVVRFHVYGGVRIGALEAAHELARIYPQLADRIYIHFGMSGWDDKPSLRRAILNDGLNQEEGHHAAQTSTDNRASRPSRSQAPLAHGYNSQSTPAARPSRVSTGSWAAI